MARYQRLWCGSRVSLGEGEGVHQQPGPKSRSQRDDSLELCTQNPGKCITKETEQQGVSELSTKNGYSHTHTRAITHACVHGRTRAPHRLCLVLVTAEVARVNKH